MEACARDGASFLWHPVYVPSWRDRGWDVGVSERDLFALQDLYCKNIIL